MVDLIHITPAQMRVFEAGAEKAFQRRVAQQVFDNAPTSLDGVDAATLARVVRAGVARARGYGLTWQSTLPGFVEIMADVSPNWDAQPKLHTALLHRRSSADASFKGLIDAVPDGVWEDAATKRSGAGWFLPLPLPWMQRRERLAWALAAALEPARSFDPAMALTLADAGQGLAFTAGLDGEDGAFLLAIGLAVAGEGRMRGVLGALDGPGRLGEAARVGVLRAWLRHNAGLWV